MLTFHLFTTLCEGGKRQLRIKTCVVDCIKVLLLIKFYKTITKTTRQVKIDYPSVMSWNTLYAIHHDTIHLHKEHRQNKKL